MKENQRSLESYEELAIYLNNLHFNLPGSFFRENMLTPPEAEVKIGNTPHAKSMIRSYGNIYSERFLNSTFKDFYKDFDEALEEVGRTEQDVLNLRNRMEEARKTGNFGDYRSAHHEFLRLQLEIHDVQINKGYKHYEIIA